MKKALFVISIFLLFISCSNEEIYILDQQVIDESHPSIIAEKFDTGTPVISIFKYYLAKDQDSFIQAFTTQKPDFDQLTSSTEISGEKYTYDGQMMDLFINPFTGSLPLYIQSDKSTSSSFLFTSSDPLPDELSNTSEIQLIGYLLRRQEPGTVPLDEYYSEIKKDTRYVIGQSETESLLKNNPGYKFIKTLGYVIPGVDNSDHGKLTLKFKYYKGMQTEVIAYVTLQQRNRTGNIETETKTYKQSIDKETSFSIDIPAKSKLISASVSLINPSYTYENGKLFYPNVNDIFFNNYLLSLNYMPNMGTFMTGLVKFVGSNLRMNIRKTGSGKNITILFEEASDVGNA